MSSKINKAVFYPSITLLIIFITVGVVFNEWFVDAITSLNEVILSLFGSVFTTASFFFLLLITVLFVSPLGGKKIGGKHAIPILSRWKWFSITLCTTLATGLLFWGMAEPLYHLNAPPLGVQTDNIISFSLSTMYVHWSFLPYAIYTVAGISFALVFYNKNQPFSLASMLHPILGKKSFGKIGLTVDVLCLFSLVAGMSASLGAGILAISGGLDQVQLVEPSSYVSVAIGLFIILTFIASSILGLHKGIGILSNINTIAFFLVIAIMIFLGNNMFVWKESFSAIGEHISTFFSRSTGIGSSIDRQWFNDWTIFYLANWFAWAPIAALFLGRIAVGYTARAFVIVNLILPSLFAIIWLSLFSGNTISIDLETNHRLYALMQSNGEESIMYAVFKHLTGNNLLGIFALMVVFISYVTAADSNISAMSALSSEGISPDTPEGKNGLKIIWGLVIGSVTCIMLISTGINGVRILSVMGGTFALLVILLSAFGLCKMIFNSFN